MIPAGLFDLQRCAENEAIAFGARRRRLGFYPWATLAALAAMDLSASTAQAQARRSDFQLWPYLTLDVPASSKVELLANAHVGLIDNASKPNQALLRALVYYKMDDRVSVGGGYTFVTFHDTPKARFDEHRTTEEVTFKSTMEADRPLITIRTRLEQRFREGYGAMSLRARLFTRLDLPLCRHGPRLIGWNETFYVLNDTGWAPGRRFDVMLNFAGVGIPISKQVSLEPGYLNSTSFLPGGGTKVDHVLGLFLTARL